MAMTHAGIPWWTRLVVVLSALVVAGCGPAAPTPLTEGDAAPAFTLPAAHGGTVALAEYRDKQPVLLYFHMADG